MKRALMIMMVLGSRVVLADEPAPDAPPPVPAQPPSGEAQQGSAQSPVTPPSTVDPPEVDAQFRQALDDFAAGHFDAAAAGFSAVANRSVDQVRRITGAEMARQSELRIHAGAATPGVDKSHDGRYGLLIGTTLLGLSLYGPALPVITQPGDSKTSVGLYMLGAGASFVVPYLATREEPVTWGMTDAWFYGSTRGALHGYFVLGLGGDTSLDSQEVMGALALGSLVEGIGFTGWASATHASAGLTNAMSQGADFGVAFGLGLSSLALDDSDLKLRWASVSGLIGAGVGYGAGYWYGTYRNPTWGDGEVLRTSGVLGAYAALVPLILASDDHSDHRKLVTGVALAGGAGGLVLGDHLLEGRHFSTGQGIVTELSTVAGALGGAGIGYLVSPSNDSDTSGKIIAVGGILGGVSGFLLTYYGLDTTIAPASGTGVSISIAPDLTPGRRGLQIAGSF